MPPKKSLTYIIGEPGVGKSTLMNYLTRDLPSVQVGGPPHEVGEPGWHPVPHIRYLSEPEGTVAPRVAAIQLGCKHESGFHGTDRLRRDIMPFLLRWICHSYPKTSDDVRHRIFHKDTFKGEGYPELESKCAREVPAHFRVLAEGDRLATEAFFDWMKELGFNVDLVHLVGKDQAEDNRKKRGGKVQDANWIKGRRTLAARLADRYGAIRVDASEPLSFQEIDLLCLPPVIALADAREAIKRAGSHA